MDGVILILSPVRDPPKASILDPLLRPQRAGDTEPLLTQSRSSQKSEVFRQRLENTLPDAIISR